MIEPSQARELKSLRDENTQLKKLVADLSLDKAMLTDVVKKSGEAVAASRHVNEAWSMDFVSDELQNGNRYRALTVVDVHTRE